MKRQYVEAPCTDAFNWEINGFDHVAQLSDSKGYKEWDYWGWSREGYVTFKPYTIEAGATVTIDTEHDWNRP